MRYLLRLRDFLRPYRGHVFLAIVCFLSLTAVELVLPAIIWQVIDVGLGRGEGHFLVVAALVILALGVLHALLAFGQRVSRFFLAVDNALGELSSRLQENVSGVQVVRAFAREPYEIQRFDQANRSLFRARVTVIGEWSKIMPTTTFLVTLGTILILWFGGRMVLQGQLTLGELVAFNSYLLLLATPAQQLGWLVNACRRCMTSISSSSPTKWWAWSARRGRASPVW
ncbi:MAG: ABC transporter transmembrane domain-containing protein [Chloroflexota bacterium]